MSGAVTPSAVRVVWTRDLPREQMKGQRKFMSDKIRIGEWLDDLEASAEIRAHDEASGAGAPGVSHRLVLLQVELTSIVNAITAKGVPPAERVSIYRRVVVLRREITRLERNLVKAWGDAVAFPVR